jgi:hypothetical protein
MGTLTTRDNQTLFWLLIIGVLFYFYVDIRINKIRDEMKWHLMYMEQIYRNSIGRDLPNSTATTKRRENFAPVDHWNTPRVVVNSSIQEDERKIKFVHDQVPSKEELDLALNEALGNTGMMSPLNNGQNGEPAAFAPVPWGSGDHFAAFN